eukprot:9351104-Pyramimonas_sp.AAC.1
MNAAKTKQALVQLTRQGAPSLHATAGATGQSRSCAIFDDLSAQIFGVLDGLDIKALDDGM